MKIVKVIIRNNKGLVALMLLLCFLTTGFAKSLNVKLQPSHSGETKKQCGKQVLNAAEENTSQSFFDTFDSDTDDADLFFHEPFPLQKFSFAEAISIVTKSAYSLYSENYNVALYDLYCNWKFHLTK
jgi:hypothetical protein